MLVALTHELANSASPVWLYLKDRCSTIDGTKRGAPMAEALQKVLRFDSIPKKIILESPCARAQNTVGTALDYRVRHHLGSFDVYDTVAVNGARLLEGVTHARAASRLAESFFEEHQNLALRLNPERTRLLEEEEKLLSRSCVVLGYYEVIFRAGTEIRSPLFELPANAKLGDLLSLPTDEVVDDVHQLSLAFEDDFRALLDAKATLNPVFSGSFAIGGADADFMLGDTLFELKTFSKFTNTHLREALYQLAGYTLLDYSDTFGIRELGIYLPRHRVIWRVPLWYILMPPAEVLAAVDRGVSPDPMLIAQLLKAARVEFEEIVAALKCLPS